MILLVNCQRECRRECQQDWKGGSTFLLCPLSFCHFTTALVCPLSFCHFFVLSFCHFTTAVVRPLSFSRTVIWQLLWFVRCHFFALSFCHLTTAVVCPLSFCHFFVFSFCHFTTAVVCPLSFFRPCEVLCPQRLSTPGLPRLFKLAFQPVCHNSTLDLPRLSNLLFSLCAITLPRIYPAF